MLAIVVHAADEEVSRSQSFASLRHLPSHAKVRSTTHLRGWPLKPVVSSVRLMMSRFQSPFPASALTCDSPWCQQTRLDHIPLTSLKYF
jgi:hypothetical protein